MSDHLSWRELLEEEYRWLFRGVFLRSPDDDWLRGQDEIVPPRPDRVGPEWRQQHRNGNTETAYTSWSTDWETARMFAEEGRDEHEVLIEGRVDEIEVSTGLEEEE
jgi:hypothetical protein